MSNYFDLLLLLLLLFSIALKYKGDGVTKIRERKYKIGYSIIIIIITDLYSAFRSEDTEAFVVSSATRNKKTLKRSEMEMSL